MNTAKRNIEIPCCVVWWWRNDE